jgi:hypothetical protein
VLPSPLPFARLQNVPSRKHLPRTDAFRGSNPDPRNPARYLRRLKTFHNYTTAVNALWCSVMLALAVSCRTVCTIQCKEQDFLGKRAGSYTGARL